MGSFDDSQSVPSRALGLSNIVSSNKQKPYIFFTVASQYVRSLVKLQYMRWTQGRFCLKHWSDCKRSGIGHKRYGAIQAIGTLENRSCGQATETLYATLTVPEKWNRPQTEAQSGIYPTVSIRYFAAVAELQKHYVPHTPVTARRCATNW